MAFRPPHRPACRGRRTRARSPHQGLGASGSPFEPFPFSSLRKIHHFFCGKQPILFDGVRADSRPGPKHYRPGQSVVRRGNGKWWLLISSAGTQYLPPLPLYSTWDFPLWAANNNLTKLAVNFWRTQNLTARTGPCDAAPDGTASGLSAGAYAGITVAALIGLVAAFASFRAVRARILALQAKEGASYSAMKSIDSGLE